MSTELVRREENAFELGKVFADSGMFPNVRKTAEAVVKIIAGREFGLGPMAAMNGIHMVDGRPTLAANLIAGQIKRSPKYDYKIIRREADGCELEFFEIHAVKRVLGRELTTMDEAISIGKMTFEKKDAERAGLLGKQNWRKYPRDMYFARCLTAGARTYCPDVLGGSPIYTAEELDADVPETAQEAAVVPLTRGAEHLATGREDASDLVTDAEVVADKPETIDAGVLGQLRDAFVASGATNNDLAWFLLSVGVESLPENPTQQDIGAAMRGLTLEQAFKIDALLKGEDDSLPGSGDAA